MVDIPCILSHSFCLRGVRGGRTNRTWILTDNNWHHDLLTWSLDHINRCLRLLLGWKVSRMPTHLILTHYTINCLAFQLEGDLYIHCLRTPRSHICIQGSVTVGPCVLSCMADLELVVLKDSLAIGSHDLSDASSLYLHPCPAATSWWFVSLLCSVLTTTSLWARGDGRQSIYTVTIHLCGLFMNYSREMESLE